MLRKSSTIATSQIAVQLAEKQQALEEARAQAAETAQAKEELNA